MVDKLLLVLPDAYEDQRVEVGLAGSSPVPAVVERVTVGGATPGAPEESVQVNVAGVLGGFPSFRAYEVGPDGFVIAKKNREAFGDGTADAYFDSGDNLKGTVTHPPGSDEFRFRGIDAAARVTSNVAVRLGGTDGAPLLLGGAGDDATYLEWPAADGNAGDVLTTDGAGNLSFQPPSGGGGGFFLGDGFGRSQPFWDGGLSVSNGQRSVRFLCPKDMRILGAYFYLVTRFGGAPNVYWAIYRVSDGALIGGVWHGLNPPSTGWLYVPATVNVDLEEGVEYWIFGNTQGTMAEQLSISRCATNNFGAINQAPFSASVNPADRAPPVCLRGIAL